GVRRVIRVERPARDAGAPIADQAYEQLAPRAEGQRQRVAGPDYTVRDGVAGGVEHEAVDVAHAAPDARILCDEQLAPGGEDHAVRIGQPRIDDLSVRDHAAGSIEQVTLDGLQAALADE